MLEKIVIEKFKRIDTVELDLDMVNILVGANNSGKTSVLQAIQFAIGAAQTAKRYGGFIKNDRVAYTGTAANFQYLPILEVESLIYEKKLTQNSGSTVVFTQKYSDNVLSVSLKRGKNRNISVNIEGLTLYKELSVVEHPYCVFTPGLSGITLSEEFRSKSIVNKSATRGDSNLYLRNILYSLHKSANDWDEFKESINVFFLIMNLR